MLLDNELVWLGYYYDASGNNVLLRDGDAVSESAVFSDSQNFAEGGVSAGDGVCIAIGKDGLLNRRTCSDMLPYACYQEWGKYMYMYMSICRFIYTKCIRSGS